MFEGPGDVQEAEEADCDWNGSDSDDEASAGCESDPLEEPGTCCEKSESSEWLLVDGHAG